MGIEYSRTHKYERKGECNMKLRKVLALVLAFALALSLCACGAKVEDELTKQTEAMFQELQNMDADTINQWMEESGGELDDLMESFSMLGMEDALNSAMDVLLAYFRECASQMTYKIAEVDTENLTVTVKCTYVSTIDFWQHYLENALAMAYDTDLSDGEAIARLLQDALDQSETDSTATTTVTVYFEKNDKGYEIIRTSDELMDVITAGLFSGLAGLEDTFSGILEGLDDTGLSDGEVPLPYEVTETPMGLLVQVYNNTETQVEPWVYVTYYDAQGTELSSDTNFLDVLPAGAAGLVPFLNYAGAEYASYEVTAAGSDGSYFYDLTSYIDVEFTSGDGEVVVDAVNTSNVSAGAVDVLVVYNKDGTPVGFGTDYLTDLAAGSSATAHCTYPYNPVTLEDLEFDSYDVYAVSYSFDEPTGTAGPAPSSTPSPGNEAKALTLVQGNLDVIYLNQYTQEYLDAVGMTQERADEEYEHGIEVERDYFANYFNIELDDCADSIEDQIEDLYRQIYTHSKYEVGEVTWDGSAYCVELTIYPIDIMQKVVNEDAEAFGADWQARGEAGEFDSMSDEEFETTWAQEVINLVSARLDGIGYLDAQTITVHVEPDSTGTYSINSDDFNTIDTLMIQY